LTANAENLRFAGGCNVGLREALGAGAEAVALLNNDTEAAPDLWVELVSALEGRARAAAAPLIFYAEPADLVWYAGGRLVPALAWASHRGLRRRDGRRYRRVERTGYLTGCCLLAPRAVWEEVGLLDESYYLYAEDADWCLRARRRGVELRFVPRARLWHRVSSSSGGARSPWKAYQRARANLLLFSRHARGLGRLTWWPCFAAQQAALGALALLRGEAKVAAALARALADHAAGRDPREFAA
jgi:GT2 family glycosyltransferase